jgi:hypothetical protein
MATLSLDIRHYFSGVNSATESQRIANNTNVHELTNFSTGRGLHFPPVRVELFLSTGLMRQDVSYPAERFPNGDAFRESLHGFY